MSYDDAFGFPAKPVTDEQRNTVLAQIQAMNAELEAEVQMNRDAEAWRKLIAMGIADAEEAIACSHTMADFVKRITEQ